MTLDEAEKMCRDEIDDSVTGTHQREYRGAMRGYNLARALLAVLPVVRAAVDLSDFDHDCGDDNDSEALLINALNKRIDTMRLTLEAK